MQGAEVASTDLRAGAALVIAGLVSEGVTRVTELKHIDRGYVNLAGKLAALGGDVERVEEVQEVVEEEAVALEETAPLTLNTSTN